jgi:hypothetical protein
MMRRFERFLLNPPMAPPQGEQRDSHNDEKYDSQQKAE